MALIEDETAARRLARTICSDIQLYNKDAIEAAGGPGSGALAVVAAEVEQGRALYTSRVVAAFLGLYDEVVGELIGGGVAPLPAGVAAAASSPTPAPAAGNRAVFVATDGGRKIDVIKVLREHLNLALRDAKELSDSIPGIVAHHLSAERARALLDALEAVGASGDLVGDD
jgi:large subunit ribosomal protein L7/L12